MGIDRFMYAVQHRAAFYDGDLRIGFDFPNSIHPIQADHNGILRLGGTSQAGIAPDGYHSDISGVTGARNRLHLLGIGRAGHRQGLPVIGIRPIEGPSLRVLPCYHIFFANIGTNLI